MANIRDAAAIRMLLEALSNSDAIVRSRQATDNGLGYFRVRAPPPTEHWTHNPAGIHNTSSSFIGIFPLLRKFIVYTCMGIILLISSLGLYALFYRIVMPGLHASETLYFDYTGMSKHPAPIVSALDHITNHNDKNPQHSNEDQSFGNNHTELNTTNAGIPPYDASIPFEQEPRQQTQTHTTDKLKSTLLQNAPWAVADLFAHQDVWEAYHYDVIPKPKTSRRVLTKGIPHYIDVILELPESQINRKYGMFGVYVELQSTNGTILASSIRTTRIPHESLWISIVRKVICIIPLMIGALEESRRVVIPSFRFYVESETLPLQYVTVRLVMTSEKLQRHEYMEVIKGNLHIGKEMTDFQLLLKEWFFTCLTFGTIFFFTLQVGILLMCQWYGEYKLQKQIQEEHNNLQDDDPSEQYFGTDDGTSHDMDNHSRNRLNSEDANNNQDIDSNSVQGEFYSSYDGQLDEERDGEWEDLPPQSSEATTNNVDGMGSSTVSSRTMEPEPEIHGSDETSSKPLLPAAQSDANEQGNETHTIPEE